MKRELWKWMLPLCLWGVLATGCSSDNDEPKPTLADAYIHKVFEFKPAVGQFVNEMPLATVRDTEETMLLKAEKAIKGHGVNREGISLGGFGGSVVFGFKNRVKNVPGFCDFRVEGNAIENASEPGVIWVMEDTNGNGLPDDVWYQIRGSEYANAIQNYEITYYRPTNLLSREAEDGDNFIHQKEYIRWEDNQGNSGYKVMNTFHTQSYFPYWVEEDKLVLKGTLLPKNSKQVTPPAGFEDSPQYWMQKPFGYGYADNYPNGDKGSAIAIDWAVDAEGKPVHLDGIDFVKVVSGVNQEAGWLGEVSTEVLGACDLHLLGIEIASE